MHDDVITFEFATHYLPKVALRLERLFAAIEQACQENHPIIHHYALTLRQMLASKGLRL